jgi:hypothetical protein
MVQFLLGPLWHLTSIPEIVNELRPAFTQTRFTRACTHRAFLVWEFPPGYTREEHASSLRAPLDTVE